MNPDSRLICLESQKEQHAGSGGPRKPLQGLDMIDSWVQETQHAGSVRSQEAASGFGHESIPGSGKKSTLEACGPRKSLQGLDMIDSWVQEEEHAGSVRSQEVASGFGP